MGGHSLPGSQGKNPELAGCISGQAHWAPGWAPISNFSGSPRAEPESFQCLPSAAGAPSREGFLDSLCGSLSLPFKEDTDSKQTINLRVDLQILQMEVKRNSLFSFPERSVDTASLILPFMTTELMGGPLGKGSQNPFILTNFQSS